MMLLCVNLSMSVGLYPLSSLLVFASNWNLLLTLACVLLTSIYADLGQTFLQKHVSLLALLHILLELSYMLNFVVLTFYWSLIHLAVINKFQGLERAHMYLVHSLPAIAIYLNGK